MKSYTQLTRFKRTVAKHIICSSHKLLNICLFKSPNFFFFFLPGVNIIQILCTARNFELYMYIQLLLYTLQKDMQCRKQQPTRQFTFSFFLSDSVDCNLGGLDFSALGWIYCDSRACLFKKYYVKDFLSWVLYGGISDKQLNSTVALCER